MIGTRKMLVRGGWMVLAGMILSSGCGGGAGTPTARGPEAGALPPALRGEPRPSIRAQTHSDASATVQPASGVPTIPAGAQFTIYCQTISGPDHVDRALRLKQQLLEQSPVRDWYVIHQEGQTTLYHGFYKSFDDPKDPDTTRAQRDRRIIDALTDQLGNRPFKLAFFVSLDAPDPIAPPEWNLTSAPGDISLQIAAYTGHPLRKQYAVEAVRAARAQGIEAYYFHGETTSSVCIGSWPESAVVRRQIVINPGRGDSEQPFIKTGIPLPEETARAQRDAQGRPLRVEQERFEITDASLSAMMQRFPEHAVNGEVKIASVVDPRTGRRIARPDSSFLVPIPRQAQSILSSGAEPAAGLPADQPIEPLPAPGQPAPGAGRLRGLEPR